MAACDPELTPTLFCVSFKNVGGRMRRRHFLAVVGGAGAWHLAAHAQQRSPARRITVLMTTAQSAQAEGYVPLDRAFEERLRELGYVNGKNVSLRNIFVAPQPTEIEDKLTEILPETDLLVVWSTVASVAAKKSRNPFQSYF